ncbi:MAG TPA: hypothetical protein PK867_08470 [Pirellulales bacterium]|nr:hypothetical protein [Pirellulales bacterium]
MPVDLSNLISARVLTACQADVQAESDSFARYVAIFGSPGESLCLALAECRHWLIATDDKQAIGISRRVGLTVVSSPEILKTWADSAAPDEATVVAALKDVERFAKFRPNRNMPECQWWLDRIGS